jgi:uncharacterized damage-inducible protein DinB
MPSTKLRRAFPFWDEVLSTLEAATGKLNEEIIDFRLNDQTRSIKEIFQHIMDVFSRDITQFIMKKDSNRTGSSLSEIREGIQNQHQLINELLSTNSVDYMYTESDFMGQKRLFADALWNVFMETLHHRGQIFMLMSSAGLEPPEV